MTVLRLGKKAARKGAISFKFADFFDAKKLPTPPASFGHYGLVKNFYGLGNDRAGNCVWAGGAHETMIWSMEGGRPRSRFTIKSVLSDYSAVTGFDPKKPETDQGTDMQIAASYRRKTGILDAQGVRHKIDSYVALEIGNVDQLVLAMWLMGAAGIGLQMPQEAMTAFDAGQVWEIPPKPHIVGGHYVPGVGRDKNGNILVVTWGKVQAMTPAFYNRFCDEAVAYISLEILNDKNLSPEGFDADSLRAHLVNLSK